MTLPTFIVIGASRAGTTSLQDYLSQHPEIHMCAVKSPNYFVSSDEQPPWETPRLRAMARQWVSSRAEYERLFDGARDASAIGEVSPVYLQSLPAAERMRRTCGDVRLVAILRDPAERAYAHFLGRRRDGLESRPTFDAVVEDELSRPLPDRIAFGSYLGASRYDHFLAPYFDRFSRIRVHRFEDLQSDPHTVLADLFDFLGVDPTFRPDVSKRHNRSGEIEGPVRRFLWTRSASLRTTLRPHLPAAIRDLALPVVRSRVTKPPLAADLRKRLIDLFFPDVERLQARTGLDLSRWRH